MSRIGSFVDISYGKFHIAGRVYCGDLEGFLTPGEAGMKWSPPDHFLPSINYLNYHVTLVCLGLFPCRRRLMIKPTGEINPHKLL
jgi:hypothetical protein